MNARFIIPSRIGTDQFTQRHDIEHRQPTMPTITENSTADGVVNELMKQQRTRSMNMRYFWMIDSQRDKKIIANWQLSHQSLAHYASKHQNDPHN